MSLDKMNHAPKTDYHERGPAAGQAETGSLQRALLSPEQVDSQSPENRRLRRVCSGQPFQQPEGQVQTLLGDGVPPTDIRFRGVLLHTTRPLMITGLRATGRYAVVLRGETRFLTPTLLSRLCVLAWSVYSNPPEGWWYYKTEFVEANAVYKAVERIRFLMEDKTLIKSDGGGCYRLVASWEDIEWHVDCLRTVVDKDIRKTVTLVMKALGVTALPQRDEEVEG